MLDDDRNRKELPQTDSAAVRDFKETRQEHGRQVFNLTEGAIDRRADSHATQAAILLQTGDRPTADFDRTRATDNREHADDYRDTQADRRQPAEVLLQPEKNQATDQGKHDSYMEKGVKDFPPLAEDGSKSWFHRDGCAWLSKDGTVTVETKLAEPSDRQNFEHFLPASTELGLKHHYDRAHSQGAGTGVESPHGITLAPREVNQELQNQGVESFIRELQAHKKDDIDLYLRTEVKTDPNGMFLERINYVLEAAKKSEGFIENRNERATLFSAGIEVTGPRDHPRVTWNADDSTPYFDRIHTVLKSPDPRQN